MFGMTKRMSDMRDRTPVKYLTFAPIVAARFYSGDRLRKALWARSSFVAIAISTFRSRQNDDHCFYGNE